MKQYPATYAEFAAFEESLAREDLVAALAALDAKDLNEARRRSVKALEELRAAVGFHKQQQEGRRCR